jgi:polysaccharide export outer membrane protein
MMRNTTNPQPRPASALPPFPARAHAVGGLLASLLLFGAVTAQTPPASLADNTTGTNAPALIDYLIGSGDVLDLKVHELDAMNARLRVAGDGTIRVAELGLVDVTGLTERQLEARLQDRLRGGYLKDPHVTIFVVEAHANVVSISGEVRQPGLYPLRGQMRLLDLISQARGLGDSAGNQAYLVRSGESTGASAPATPPQPTAIDLDALLVQGEAAANLPLRTGDCITVPRAGFIHITGAGVPKPGSYAIQDGARTIRQLIDQAGGLRFSASHKLTLIHAAAGDAGSITQINYGDLESDPTQDHPLQPGDTLVVGTQPVKLVFGAIGDLFNRIFRLSTVYNLSSH